MTFHCKHAVLRVTDILASREFYHEKLGLELLEDYPNFFVVKAGEVRISVFGGFDSAAQPAEEITGYSLILSTDDIEQAKAELEQRGVLADADIMEAPGFMKYVDLKDPSGNLLHIAQYLTTDVFKKLV